jgi:TonB family protein
MHKSKNNPLLFYTASLSLHAMLFLIAIIFLDWSHEVPTLGDTAQEIISSYMYAENSVATPQSVMHAQKSVSRPHSLALKMNSQSRRNEKQSKENNHAESVPSHQAGVQTQELLALLHAAIQAQQRYPLSAMEMERQGSVTIKFLLLPNGKIENLRMVHSSGTDSLDEAALAAVKNAAPFKDINRHLTSAREFSIDVVFELA